MHIPQFCLSTHSPMETWAVSAAAMNTGVQIHLWDLTFSAFGYIPRSGVVGPYGDSIFNFLRNCHTVSYSSCIILNPCQQCTRVSISLNLCQHLLSIFSIVVILMDVKWYCGFDLQSPNDSWCWVSFHVLVDHLCVIFEKCLLPFFSCFLLSFRH